MKVSELDLKEMLDFNPETGILKLGSQRMVIMPADSIGMLMKFIMDISDKNMFDMFMEKMGEAAGRKDAETLKKDFNPDTEMDWIALGPTMHTWEGIVHATLDTIEFDREKGTYHGKGKWLNSFVADEWLKYFGESDSPVCSLLTGYANGYASEFIGKEVETRELQCKAMGDPHCVFEQRIKSEWDD